VSDSVIQVPDAEEPDVFTTEFFDVVNGFDFADLRPASVPVNNIPRAPNRKFVLKEASTEAARRYRNAAMKAAKMQDAKVVGVEGLADADPLLVSLCLFEINDKVTVNGQPQLVATSPQLVASLEHRVTKRLAEWVRFHSDLKEEPQTEEALEKEIGKLNERLAKLREDNNKPLGETTEGKEQLNGEVCST